MKNAYLSFIDDSLIAIRPSFSTAKAALIDVLDGKTPCYWTFSRYNTYFLMESETKDGKITRIVECLDEFKLKHLNFGCTKWQE